MNFWEGNTLPFSLDFVVELMYNKGMKRINFTKITIKNFLSIGNEPLTVNFKQGVSVIRGVNKDEEDIKNGVGNK